MGNKANCLDICAGTHTHINSSTTQNRSAYDDDIHKYLTEKDPERAPRKTVNPYKADSDTNLIEQFT